MKRVSYLFGILAIAAGAVPGCSGTEFTAADENDAGETGEAGAGDTGGKGGTSGKGGSSSGTAGSDVGGSDVGGNGNGGTGRGGTSGTNSGGSQTGGDAGEGATGGTGPGGMGGTAGTGPTGGTSGTAGSFPSGGTSGTAGSFPTGGTSGIAGSFPTGGTSGSGGSAGQTSCPVNPPIIGAPCSFTDYCSYGTHPTYHCRNIYDCFQNGWQLSTQPGCDTPPSCDDSSTPPIVGEECMTNGYECRLEQNVFCMCGANCTSVCSLPPVWHCFGPPAGCPATLPNHGQPCSGNSACVYGTCPSQTAVNVNCENGTWRWRTAACPN